MSQPKQDVGEVQTTGGPPANYQPGTWEEEHEHWQNELAALSGTWKSPNGSIRCVLDYRVMRLETEGNWGDLHDRVFLLGQSMDFMTKFGHYTVTFGDDEPDTIVLVRENLESAELDSVKLMRERGANAGN